MIATHEQIERLRVIPLRKGGGWNVPEGELADWNREKSGKPDHLHATNKVYSSDLDFFGYAAVRKGSYAIVRPEGGDRYRLISVGVGRTKYSPNDFGGYESIEEVLLFLQNPSLHPLGPKTAGLLIRTALTPSNNLDQGEELLSKIQNLIGATTDTQKRGSLEWHMDAAATAHITDNPGRYLAGYNTLTLGTS